ncbi:hypothetical protein [Nocardioides marmoribigeumensis]|jgi:hypothetical protein|uniref:Uncharacterized protein n=1 Tax=Nocardioides marmoribigeumensis TaxID=433649 RepID=A0ABU2BY00_9ACTN|nr:hypothetical protein [Nocardioides marmoribigeumensis]MDR7363286.1 hypothetical protein [Nocardioides marmoribigeumensis]
MNPWTTLASALQALPPSVRRTLYTIVTAAGAFLAVAQLAGWKDLGFTDLDTALKTYALISSPTGVLALANVKPKDGDAGWSEGLAGFEGFRGFDGPDGDEDDDADFELHAGSFDADDAELVDEGSFS